MAHGDLVFWSINVPDVERARQFFAALFGWTYSAPGPSGAVVIEGRQAAMHPSAYRDPAAVWFDADDFETVLDGVRRAGGTGESPEGLTSRFVDPWGARAALAHPREGGAPRALTPGHGELMRWTVESCKATRSAELLGGLLGWSLEADAGGGYHAEDLLLPGGLREAAEPGAGASFRFEVDDLQRARARVGELGGRVAAAPADGRHADAADDQGYRFGISQAG